MIDKPCSALVQEGTPSKTAYPFYLTPKYTPLTVLLSFTIILDIVLFDKSMDLKPLTLKEGVLRVLFTTLYASSLIRRVRATLASSLEEEARATLASTLKEGVRALV